MVQVDWKGGGRLARHDALCLAIAVGCVAICNIICHKEPRADALPYEYPMLHSFVQLYYSRGSRLCGVGIMSVICHAEYCNMLLFDFFKLVTADPIKRPIAFFGDEKPPLIIFSDARRVPDLINIQRFELLLDLLLPLCLVFHSI